MKKLLVVLAALMTSACNVNQPWKLMGEGEVTKLGQCQSYTCSATAKYKLATVFVKVTDPVNVGQTIYRICRLHKRSAPSHCRWEVEDDLKHYRILER